MISFLCTTVRLLGLLSLASSFVFAQAPATPPPGSEFTFLDWRRITTYGYVQPNPGALLAFQDCVPLCQASVSPLAVVAWSTWTGNCYCGSTLPPAATGATQSNYLDTSGFQVFTTGSTFSFVQCGAENVGVGIPQLSNTLKNCFFDCRFFSIAAFNFDDEQCYCANGNPFTGPSSCSVTGADVQYYSHSADTTASGIQRRRRMLSLQRVNLDPNLKFCPAGMTACLVEGGKEGYECLSVDSELESCGGCLKGRSAVSAGLSTVGRDCSAIPGVSLGGVTCHKGSCDVSSCRKGWTLRDDGCVRTQAKKT